MPAIRPTARLILVDPDSRVLLFRHHEAHPLDPRHAAPFDFWATPGGGAEPGESLEQAARRELLEETGSVLTSELTIVARREILLAPEGLPAIFRETFFLARTPAFDVTPTALNAAERATIRAHRWWTLHELLTSGADVVPPGAAEFFARCAQGQLPPAAIDL